MFFLSSEFLAWLFLRRLTNCRCIPVPPPRHREPIQRKVSSIKYNIDLLGNNFIMTTSIQRLLHERREELFKEEAAGEMAKK